MKYKLDETIRELTETVVDIGNKPWLIPAITANVLVFHRDIKSSVVEKRVRELLYKGSKS